MAHSHDACCVRRFTIPSIVFQSALERDPGLSRDAALSRNPRTYRDVGAWKRVSPPRRDKTHVETDRRARRSKRPGHPRRRRRSPRRERGRAVRFARATRRYCFVGEREASFLYRRDTRDRAATDRGVPPFSKAVSPLLRFWKRERTLARAPGERARATAGARRRGGDRERTLRRVIFFWFWENLCTRARALERVCREGLWTRTLFARTRAASSRVIFEDESIGGSLAYRDMWCCDAWDGAFRICPFSGFSSL